MIDHRGRIVFDESENEWHLYIFAEKPGRWAWICPNDNSAEVVVLCEDRDLGVIESHIVIFSEALRIAKEWIDSS